MRVADLRQEADAARLAPDRDPSPFVVLVGDDRHVVGDGGQAVQGPIHGTRLAARSDRSYRGYTHYKWPWPSGAIGGCDEKTVASPEFDDLDPARWPYRRVRRPCFHPTPPAKADPTVVPY
jgi:hypothetical protein